ncbi:speckle-type poz protein [Anaeramoeba flamelloides]|uniref:Speckle-type poz protein n=1 Tax=Anaeramoeba flamelloides TaxID=1746091 RepID=A0AAV7YMP3_9EUKA|nr:speckle-type poz protein [Anaeramoeba flamelloides]
MFRKSILQQIRAFDKVNLKIIEDHLEEDLLELFNKGWLSDSVIKPIDGGKIEFHKMFLEFRILSKIKLTYEELLEKMKECDKNELMAFFSVVYCGTIPFSQNNHLSNAIDSMKFENSLIKKLKSRESLNKDLLVMYKNEKSKDFTIIVEEDVDEEEPEVEEIKIHKLILIARSKTYRDLILNVEEEVNKIKDYSGKSPETIKTLARYLYTSKMGPWTADDDIKLVLEEMDDVLDYYQLNLNSVGLNKKITQAVNNFIYDPNIRQKN